MLRAHLYEHPMVLPSLGSWPSLLPPLSTPACTDETKLEAHVARSRRQGDPVCSLNSVNNGDSRV